MGRPVLDLLAAGASGVHQSRPVAVTGGERETSNGDWYGEMPKRDLIIGLQVLAWNAAGLEIAAGGLRFERVTERVSADAEFRVSAAGREQYRGVAALGEHDDLVICGVARVLGGLRDSIRREAVGGRMRGGRRSWG